jgi:hypothetical protein
VGAEYTTHAEKGVSAFEPLKNDWGVYFKNDIGKANLRKTFQFNESTLVREHTDPSPHICKKY